MRVGGIRAGYYGWTIYIETASWRHRPPRVNSIDNSQILPNTSPNPPKTFPNSFQNRFQIDPKGFFQSILTPCLQNAHFCATNKVSPYSSSAEERESIVCTLVSFSPLFFPSFFHFLFSSIFSFIFVSCSYRFSHFFRLFFASFFGFDLGSIFWSIFG